MTNPLLEIALRAEAVGISVLPPCQDGTKKPLAEYVPELNKKTWVQWQAQRATTEKIRTYYPGYTGLGYVCGAISGNLECLDFDNMETYHAYKPAAEAVGLGDLVQRIEAGYSEKTPHGVHWLYRCEQIAGNTKLAKRPKGVGISEPDTLIETRGEGGFIISAPSNGTVHPDGGQWEMISGSVETIATITPEERQAFHDLARTFDEMPQPGISQPQQSPNIDGERPGDVFNQRADWRSILEPQGWKLVYQRGDVQYWRRPGKNIGISATTNHNDSDYLYVFSSSTVFESERGYSKFSAYSILEHGGDFQAAAKTLLTQGYGTPKSNGQVGSTTTGKPRIDAGIGSLPKVTKLAWEALFQTNDPVYIMRYGGMAVRLEKSDTGLPFVAQLTQDRLRFELGHAATWYKPKDTKAGSIEVDTRPPLDVVRNMLATPDLPLPILRGIVEAPIIANDGSLQTSPGYNPNGGIYYAPAEGLIVPPVSDTPTIEEIDKAKGLIDEILVDFPFVEDADRTNAIGLLLLPFARELIEGPTPNHLIEAPGAGNGKGLLNDCLLYPAIGHDVALMPEGSDNAEWEKQITAALLKVPQAVTIDNVTQPIKSGNLAMAYTARRWGARILGRSENVDLPVRCVWTMTANNPTMSDEIMRRTVRIRIDAKRDRPWERQDFRHENLREWVQENRGRLIWAALTLIRNWIAKGKPKSTAKALGSFEDWTKVIGGILAAAGIDGFLANLPKFYETADLEGQVWRNFVNVWWESFRENEVGTADLFPLAIECEGFDFGQGKEKAQKTAFGMQLAKKRDCVIGEYRIVKAGITHKVTKWRLLPIKDLFTTSREESLPEPQREPTKGASFMPNMNRRMEAILSSIGFTDEQIYTMKPEKAFEEMRAYLFNWGKARNWAEFQYGPGRLDVVSGDEYHWQTTVEQLDYSELMEALMRVGGNV